MSGVNEILVVVAILAAIFLLPRMMPAKRQIKAPAPSITISGKIRLAIAASVIYPLATAAYFQPWRKDMVLFLYIGIGPVALAWLLAWVYVGIKGGRRPVR